MRRERPHPGAQLDAFEEADGWRYTAFATDTAFGQLAHLGARHRAHARVEDRIRGAKDTGLNHFPSRSFAINQAWLTVTMLAVDLLAATQHLLLHGALAKAEPKALRYRLLHVAARLTRGQRRCCCASSGPGPGPATSLARSPSSPHCPPQPVDRPSRHDERRELPAERARRQHRHAHQPQQPPTKIDPRVEDQPAAL